MTNTQNLPIELKKDGLFCCWRYETRPGSDKPTKVPYNPVTGGKAQSTNPATFAPVDVADAVQGQYDGLGIGIFGDISAIDIDHCVDEHGVISDSALDICQIMSSYTEYSPSGTGLRILFRASGFQYDTGRYYINNQSCGLEVYVGGVTNKYVTVTGNDLAALGLEERGAQLQTVLDKYMRRPERKKAARDKVAHHRDSDSELIKKMTRSSPVFERLWAGDTSSYKSRSEADLALCNTLAWWTNSDAARIDGLFRRSGLMRDKWDRPQSGSTYGAITIQKAVEDCQGGYDPAAFLRQKIAKALTPVSSDSGHPLALGDMHPESNPRYGWNDIGSGNLFADRFKDIARFVPERKKWFVYNGKIWEADTGNLKVMELCKRMANELVVYALGLPEGDIRDRYRSFVERWQLRRNREIILKDASSVYPVGLSEFDKDPWVFNCQNGTLNLRTREFHPHSAADMLTELAGVSYDPAARCDRWERFMDEIMCGDAERVLFLQKAFGYSLTGDTSEECFFLLFGATTRNGKSTAVETIMRLLGSYARSAKPDTIAMSKQPRGGAPSEDIARLAGARIVNIAEPEKGLVLSSALVKTLTGGDTVNARFLNENSFEFRPQFKLFVNTNYLPQITDITLFSSGRVKVVPFERHFTAAEQDRGLKRELGAADSLSGILNWCLDGLRLFQELGLQPPQSVINATDQYRLDSDKIARFISDEMEEGRDYEVRTSEAYERYKSWCIRNGFNYGSIKTWNGEMQNAVTVKRKRPTAGGSPTTLIVGYRLKYAT